MKKHMVPIFAGLLAVSLGFNVYLYSQISSLNVNISTQNENLRSLEATNEILISKVATMTLENQEGKSTISNLKKQLKKIEDQSEFEADFDEILINIAHDTSMTVDERKAGINEFGTVFDCTVDKYLAMIGDGGEKPTPSVEEPPVTTTPPATNPPVTTAPPATTPPVTTPPVTTPPKDTATPGAVPNTGSDVGGRSTEGKTDKELDDMARESGWGSAGIGQGGVTTHPDDKLNG